MPKARTITIGAGELKNSGVRTGSAAMGALERLVIQHGDISPAGWVLKWVSVLAKSSHRTHEYRLPTYAFCKVRYLNRVASMLEGQQFSFSSISVTVRCWSDRNWKIWSFERSQWVGFWKAQTGCVLLNMRSTPLETISLMLCLTLLAWKPKVHTLMGGIAQDDQSDDQLVIGYAYFPRGVNSIDVVSSVHLTYTN